MSEELIYNKKLALITAIIITLGGLLLQLIIHSSSDLFKNQPFPFDTYFFIFTPLIWILSFAPLFICWIVNKFQKEKK